MTTKPPKCFRLVINGANVEHLKSQMGGPHVKVATHLEKSTKVEVSMTLLDPKLNLLLDKRAKWIPIVFFLYFNNILTIKLDNTI